MTTLLYRLCPLWLFLLSTPFAPAAETDPLPIDPAVTIKKLPNGLTY